MPFNNNWIKIGSLIAALAVVLGGVDTKALIEMRVADLAGATASVEIDQVSTNGAGQSEERDFDLATFFQLTHALAIVAIGILLMLRQSRLLKASAWCFMLGIALFSGTIYLSALTSIPWLELYKLIGVVSLVVGWILLVEGACPGWEKRNADKPKTAS